MRRSWLVLALLVALLALGAAACGGDDEAAAPPAPAEPEAPAEPTEEPPAEPTEEPPAEPTEEPPAEPAGPDEFGETYDADPAVIEKALYDATLLPADEVARQVALAAFDRADNPVDYALALECWKNNGCDTGSGGELTAAYLEAFGENVYREVAKMEFILQALTYPEIGEIIYVSSKAFTATPGDPLADFRTAIAQGADVIVNYPDIADAYLPVFQEATAAGIPVSTYAGASSPVPARTTTPSSARTPVRSARPSRRSSTKRWAPARSRSSAARQATR